MSSSPLKSNMVLTALLASLVLMGTMWFKIPLASGYVNLGDGMIFLAVLLLGGRYGAIAAMIGSTLGDVFGGYAIWAPFTLVIKGGMALWMALTLTLLLSLHKRKHAPVETLPPIGLFVCSMMVATLWMMLGYYVAEWMLYQTHITPLIGIAGNLGQGILGILLAVFIAVPLSKTPARQWFTYPVTGKLS